MTVDTKKLRELAVEHANLVGLTTEQLAKWRLGCPPGAVIELLNVLQKISDIRDGIIGAQAFNWSEHAYPLVAALSEVGFHGVGYDIARKNLGTLLAQLAAVTEARDEACKMIQKLVDAQERYSPAAVAASPEFAAMKREIDRRIAELRKVGAQ